MNLQRLVNIQAGFILEEIENVGDRKRLMYVRVDPFDLDDSRSIMQSKGVQEYAYLRSHATECRSINSNSTVIRTSSS